VGQFVFEALSCLLLACSTSPLLYFCFAKIGATGFEPATLWSQTTRSTKLSYAP
jgi:hypothetical protein